MSTVCKKLPYICFCFFPDDRQSFLSFQKGDLIVLEQMNGDGANFINSSWCYGECLRTRLSGDFPAECVYVLPTITKPPTEILVSRQLSRWCELLTVYLWNLSLVWLFVCLFITYYLVIISYYLVIISLNCTRASALPRSVDYGKARIISTLSIAGRLDVPASSECNRRVNQKTVNLPVYQFV